MLYNIERYSKALQSILQQAAPGQELEWRLGTITDRFISEVPIANKLLDKYKFTKTNYTVMLYAGGIRVRDGKSENKKRIAVCDLDYLPIAIRLALSTEQSTQMPPNDEIPTDTREIERWTTHLGGSDLMISQVDGKWEVEIEFVQIPKTLDELLRPLLRVLADLIPDRPNMVARPDIINAAHRFNQEWSSSPQAGFLKRIGYRPLNFIASDCDLLMRHEYAVSNKLDGTKYNLICSGGSAFAISEMDAIYLGKGDDPRSFDGEWDHHDKQLLLFDYITREPLDYIERIKIVESTVAKLRNTQIIIKTVEFCEKTKSGWRLSPLQAVDRVIAAAKKRYGDDWLERNDGIIMTPINETYLAAKEREHRTLKWKFPDKISVDVRLRLQRSMNSENEFVGYAQDVQDRETKIPDMVIHDTSGDAKDGQIAEIGIDSGKFYIMRMRPDKSNANFVTVVSDTLKDMRDPFTLEQLLVALGKKINKKGGAEDQLIPELTEEQIADAKKWVDIDRQKFLNAYKCVLEFAKNNNLKLSNPECLLSQNIPTVINLYAKDGLRTANDLANALYGINPIVFMKTVIPYAEFEISILNRQFVRIYVYPRVRHIQTDQLFKSMPLKIIDIDLSTLSADIELINIYHKLYQPFPDKWKCARDLEQRLSIEPTVIGGAPERTDFVLHVRTALYDALEFNDLGVLIGHWGVFELDSTKTVLSERIQLLSNLSPEEMKTKLEGVLRDITPMKLTYKTEELMIPHDLHLRYTSYYFDWQGKRIILAGVYNSLEYEIVPTVIGLNKKMRVGNPYVLQRFLLIDKWMLSVLEQGRYITTDCAKGKRHTISILVKKLREPKYVAMTGGDDYVGTYKDLAIERRRVLKQEEKFRPYKPLEHFTRFGRLRVMGGGIEN